MIIGSKNTWIKLDLSTRVTKTKIRSWDCLDCEGAKYWPTAHFVKDKCKLTKLPDGVGTGDVYGYEVKDSLWLDAARVYGLKRCPNV